MKNFLIPATQKNIDFIMRVEEDSFLPGIQEKRSVFLERISVFPEGFLLQKVLDDDRKEQFSGYFTSEIWQLDLSKVSSSNSFLNNSYFTLDHSIKEKHNSQGNTLYISSFGILSQYRGYGLGKALFKDSVFSICKQFPSIKYLLLIVNETWQKAKKIYCDEGFREIQTLPNFFLPSLLLPQNAIVMKKDLL